MTRTQVFRTRRLTWILPVVGALTLSPMSAWGQTVPAETDPAALFDEGVRLCEEGDFAAALDRFRAVQAIRPHPFTLANIGRCAEEAGDLVGALEAYEALEALGAEAVANLPAGQRREIRAAVPRLREQIGGLRILPSRDGLDLLLDGRALGRGPFVSPIRVRSGRHVLEAHLEGFEPGRAEVDVQAATEVEVRIDVGPAILRPSEAPGPRPRQARLRFEAPSGVRVLVDGAPIGRQGLVPLGEHRVEAIGPGGLRSGRRIRMGPNGLAGRARVEGRMSWIFGATAAGIAVVAGGIALVTWSSALDAERSYNDPATPIADRVVLREDALGAGRTTDVLVGVSLAATGAAIVLGLLWVIDRAELVLDFDEPVR